MKPRTVLPLLRIFLDLAALALSSYVAVFLRFDGHDVNYTALWRHYAPVALGIHFAAIAFWSGYRREWRYTSLTDLARIILAISASSALLFFIVRPAGHSTFPRWVLIEWFISVNLCVGLRIGTRAAAFGLRRFRHGRSTAGASRRRVLIVGAGTAGAWIARAIAEEPEAGRHVIAFLDDDPGKRSLRIHGVPVVGPVEDLPAEIAECGADEVLVAISNCPAARIQDIVRLVEATPAQLTILPSIPQMVSGVPSTRLIRNIRLEDLLERQPVCVDLAEIAGYIAGERVLVTGAGGSIGAELCRQIARLDPESLIILGQGEHSIFWIERELRSAFGIRPIPIIADIKDRAKLDRIFAQYRPTVLFHAAAHKHVPLMEQNPDEAIKNNVFGTRNLAELAVRHGLKRFVMISTDKAVNPTSVMGATKRVAEMVVQSLAQRCEAARRGEPVRLPGLSRGAEAPATRFSAVRFGNVLGSRGSVVPTMQRQIEEGGPVTVTDPEMVRFFMTIPEAAQLVIQAGAMSRASEIFVLDMGQPVKIMDLARNLIRLNGFAPGRDIEIRITGMRPGEKLYEEVLTDEEGIGATAHEKILVARPSHVDHDRLSAALERLERLAHDGDPEAIRQALRDIVPAYGPEGLEPEALAPADTERRLASGDEDRAMEAALPR